MADPAEQPSTAELGSALSSIEALAQRMESTARGVGEEHPMAPGLLDVERSLRAAARRLERLLRDLSR